jgi:16S rRNA (cytosine967-C5)-methyltransferase
MSKFHSHITSAIKLINAYSAGRPLAIHIKSFFAANKKFGSKDRRTIASLCYYYYRTGRAFNKYTVEEKILAGLFLCESKSNELLHFFRPELDKQIGQPTSEKLSMLNINTADLFPFALELSEDIDKDLFALSFIIQPRIYLRIRPGRNKMVVDKLNSASVQFELMNDTCIILQNNVSAEKILMLNKDAVIQDLNSQMVLNYLEKVPEFLITEQKIVTWDCCAASGGKSILLYDKINGNIKLTVSDIRESILVNLNKRLQQAGIHINRAFVSDLSVESALTFEEKFSLIICDAPCTGSGTWGRNPEQLYFFDKKKIGEFAERQRKIVSNTIPHLAKGGLFFYITCSVFKKENEDVVKYIKENLSDRQEGLYLHLVHMEYLKGYESAADTMFVGVFQLS